jgi:multicomponent Na+:H+ antiporter subunit E
MAAWITLVWLALWGDLSPANVLGGVLVSALVLTIARLPGRMTSHRVAVLPALRYAALFVRDLCVATAEVARQVFWPIARLRPAILAVPMRSSDPGLLALVANTITLTPGTLTLEADAERSMLWVHLLHLEEGEKGQVVEAVRALEQLGARALGVDLDARTSSEGLAAGRPAAGRQPARRQAARRPAAPPEGPS